MGTLKPVLGCGVVVMLMGASVMARAVPAHLRCEYLMNPLSVPTDRPELSWIVEADGRGVAQTAWQVLAAGSAAELAENKGELWDSGKVDSDETAHIVYAGKPLSPGQDVYWKVRLWTGSEEPSEWSRIAHFRVGYLQAGDWKAKWIGVPGTVPEGKLPARPSPMLRKGFKLGKPIKRALASASALGLYELRINGRRVGDQLLAPEWTNYHKRVQYQTYDVTGFLKEGENAVGAILADGWYAGRLGISHILGKDDPLRGFYGKQLGLLVQIDIEYADGSCESVVTDASWKATTDGPIRRACLLDGEVYDARKEMAGWDAAGFNDGKWGKVEELPALKAVVVAQHNEPIRVTEELIPVSISEPKPGVYVADFGQNIAGWCRLLAKGKPGEPVILRHAEVLNSDGTIYRDNLRMEAHKQFSEELGARQEEQYFPRTAEEERYEPHFTYHGFRYVEITGVAEKPVLTTLVARAFHSTPPMAGEFECSSPLLNKLMTNIVWTHRDNMHSVPTDCPQRDERMGWMGDMLVFAQPACFNMDMAAFFTKWIQDIRDDQAEDGRYPDFAPHPFDPNKLFSGVPSWGDCGVVVPWRMFVNYADKEVLEKHFESARRWVDWIHKHNPNLLWAKQDDEMRSRGNDYGDWLNGDTFKLEGYPKGEAEIPKDVFATAFFQHSAELVSKMAQVIGREAEAAQYRKLAEDIKAAFNKAYVQADGTVQGNTQSAYALALNFNLLPEEIRPAAAKKMVERIEAYKNHISTGFHTTIMLMNELTRNGYTDWAYRLINNRTMPSWGYTIDHGATTIWERWDGYVEGRGENGYQDPSMNSFNHYAIGSVGEWMYRSILGINPDESRPGYRHFTLAPRPGGGLTWARGHYDSIRGRIVSDWKIQGQSLVLNVKVPANTTATLRMPAADMAAVTESGKPADAAEGVKFVKMEEGAAIYELGSGCYRFVSRGFANR